MLVGFVAACAVMVMPIRPAAAVAVVAARSDLRTRFTVLPRGKGRVVPDREAEDTLGGGPLAGDRIRDAVADA
jgi:hypothetical protein